MDLENRLAISYYKEIATINESHKIYLVQHQETRQIRVKKILDVFNPEVYKQLRNAPIAGIPKVIEFCPLEKQLIVIEEYIQGSTLEELMESKALTVHKIVEYSLALCKILKSLHAMNPPLVHRDIKPSNILITEHDNLYLLDFNAAKPYSSDSEKDTVLLGSPGYAAPEQYGFGASTPQTDIYSLGIVMREMLLSIECTNPQLMKIAEHCTQLSPKARYNKVELLEKDLMTYIRLSEAPNKPHKWDYLPPGYRTKNSIHMLVATIAYFFIFALSLTIDTGRSTYSALWIERIFLLLCLLTLVIVPCNYLGIQNIMPFSRSKYMLVRLAGSVILCAGIIVSMFVLLILTELFLFSSTTAL